MNRRIFNIGLLVLTVAGVGAATNAPTIIKDPSASFFANSQKEFWQLGIALITPAIVYFIGKVPQIPRPVLPTITPILGILIGLALKHLADLNLSWIDMGQAGAAGVAIREIVNQWVTQKILAPTHLEAVTIITGTKPPEDPVSKDTPSP